MLSITGSETLFSCLNRITLMVLSRIENLSARRRSRSESVVDFSVSDSMLFWFLHGLNTIYPELKHLNDYPQKHPEEFYKLLVRLLGMLYTFRANESVKEIDSYDHFDLFGTFNRLEQKIRDLLDEVIPSPVIELSLEHLKSTHWRARYLMTESMLMQSFIFPPTPTPSTSWNCKNSCLWSAKSVRPMMWSG